MLVAQLLRVLLLSPPSTAPCCTCSGPQMGLPIVWLLSTPSHAGGAGSEVAVADPAGARRLCFAWHPRQDLSSSLWKQAAQCVNPIGLGAPAPLQLMVSLSPAPSPGCKAGDGGDSSILARCLGQGDGACSPKSLCGRWHHCPGVLGAVAGKHSAASGLGGDGASSRGAPKPPRWVPWEQPLRLSGLTWVLHQVLSPGATPPQVLHRDPKHGWSSSWKLPLHLGTNQALGLLQPSCASNH